MKDDFSNLKSFGRWHDSQLNEETRNVHDNFAGTKFAVLNLVKSSHTNANVFPSGWDTHKLTSMGSYNY